MDESLLVGEGVRYVDDYGKEEIVLVMGVAVIKHKITDVFPTTGYSVMTDESGSIKHIPYWQVKSIIDPDDAYLAILKKKGNEIDVTFPKYEKKPHPRGWEVDQTANDDLPM